MNSVYVLLIFSNVSERVKSIAGIIPLDNYIQTLQFKYNKTNSNTIEF